MSEIYTSKVIEVCDNGDVIIELPPELLKEVGWETNDIIELEEKDGKIYLKKANGNE